jgi:phage-related protein
MEWRIEYYNQRVRSEIGQLPKHLLARYQAIVDKIEIYGPDLGMPHIRYLSNGLLEMRLKGQEGIARVFYCVIKKKTITILHSFVKKSQKTPKNDLDLAMKRMKEVKIHEL